MILYKLRVFWIALIALVCTLLGPQSSLRAQSPAGWWTFDAGSGTTAADSSGNGHTGTLQSGATWTSSAEVGPNALSLNGGDVDIPGPVVDTASSFTATCWVKLNTTGNFQTLMSIDGNTVSGFFLQYRPDLNRFAFTMLASDAAVGPNYAISAMQPVTGVWYHLAGVYDSTAKTISLYVNGGLQQTEEFTTPWTASGDTLIGRGKFGGNLVDFSNAIIDDARLYSSPLTSSAIQSLAGGTGPLTAINMTANAASTKFAMAPNLYGLMIEDINHSIDGGLYAECVQNRVFKDNGGSLAAWSILQTGGSAGTLALDTTQPVSGTALTNSGKLVVTSIGSGVGPGIVNSGYWGIGVKPSTTYNCSFYAKQTGFTGPLTVMLESNGGGTVWAQATVSSVSTAWTKYSVALTTGNSIAASSSNELRIAAKGAGTVWFTQVSLMPPAYNSRPNGSRIDLMNLLGAMGPKFLRLPGGNYLEGPDNADRFEWSSTIHDISQRPGHNDPWGYRSNDGYGLLEYLEWCEDLGMQPVLAVYAGYSLDNTVVTGSALQPYVTDAINEIQYATGSTSTTYGAMRAADGHPNPFNISYVEIGNEDFFDATNSYDSRFTMFYDQIKAAYPSIKLIATTTVTSRTPDVSDEHYYFPPQFGQANAHLFDSQSRSGPKIFIGEWASGEGNPTPDMNSALGDASWLTGLENNSDLVVMESYAPLLANVNSYEWGTNLIGFDALNSYGSPSYYMQKLFAGNHGDAIVNTTTSNATFACSISKSSVNGTLYIHMVNPFAQQQPVSIAVSGTVLPAVGTAYTMNSANLTDVNSITNPTNIVPVMSTFPTSGNTINYTIPANSIVVLTCPTGPGGAPVSGGKYMILNQYSGMALDDPFGSTTPGTLMQQWYNWGGPPQQWVCTASGGNYTIVNQVSGLALDDTNWSTTPGTLVQEWTNWNGAPQQWQIVPLADGSCQIINGFSGLALDDYNWSTTAGSSIDLWTNINDTVQHWFFQPTN